MTQDALEAKKEQLEELEKSEREARRLEQALGRGRVNSEPSAASPSEEQGGEPQSQSTYLPPHPGPSPSRRRAPGMGLLNALSYTLHGMMDVDPETARRNGITKTRESISQVCSPSFILFVFDKFRSSRMRCISPHRISNIPALPSRLI